MREKIRDRICTVYELGKNSGRRESTDLVEKKKMKMHSGEDRKLPVGDPERNPRSPWACPWPLPGQPGPHADIGLS